MIINQTSLNINARQERRRTRFIDYVEILMLIDTRSYR